MPKSNWELWGIIIAIIEFDINYYIYSQTESIINVLIVIISSLIIALTFIISDVYSKIKESTKTIDEFNKKLIRDKEFEDIRLDLREIKREIFKK